MKKLILWMDRCSRMSFILMIVVGAYLFYAIKQMLSGLDSLTGSPVPVYIFAVLFFAAGVVLAAVGAFALLSGHYREKRALPEAQDVENEGNDDSIDGQ